MNRIRVIDSHTGGEPTRVIVAGGPDLGGELEAKGYGWIAEEVGAAA